MGGCPTRLCWFNNRKRDRFAAPNTIQPQANITIKGVQPKCVESFKYLSSTTSADGSLDSEISSRTNKASQALGRLKLKVLQQKGIRLSTKIKVYKAVIVSTLLYGCETWTPYRRHVKQLEPFHTRAHAQDHGHLLAGQSDKERSARQSRFNKHRVNAP